MVQIIILTLVFVFYSEYSGLKCHPRIKTRVLSASSTWEMFASDTFPLISTAFPPAVPTTPNSDSISSFSGFLSTMFSIGLQLPTALYILSHYSSVHSLILQILIEHMTCSKHRTRCSGYNSMQDKHALLSWNCIW